MDSRLMPVFRATIKQDRIVWAGADGDRWELLKQLLRDYDVEITMRPARKRRSIGQNRYYWHVICEMIAEAAGYTTKEEAHEALSAHFLTEYGEYGEETVRSTKSLTTEEFENYCERCRQLGAEIYRIYIPRPHEVTLAA